MAASGEEDAEDPRASMMDAAAPVTEGGRGADNAESDALLGEPLVKRIKLSAFSELLSVEEKRVFVLGELKKQSEYTQLEVEKAKEALMRKDELDILTTEAAKKALVHHEEETRKEAAWKKEEHELKKEEYELKKEEHELRMASLRVPITQAAPEAPMADMGAAARPVPPPGWTQDDYKLPTTDIPSVYRGALIALGDRAKLLGNHMSKVKTIDAHMLKAYSRRYGDYAADRVVVNHTGLHEFHSRDIDLIDDVIRDCGVRR
jgi:hypothetical protein